MVTGLTPPDFYFRVCIKDNVYVPSQWRSLRELWDRLSDVGKSASEAKLCGVWDEIVSLVEATSDTYKQELKWWATVQEQFISYYVIE